MTDKQLAVAVRFGRKITFFPVDSSTLTGYLGGWDRYNYFVLVPVPNESELVRTYLVHKSVPVMEIHPDSTFDKEPVDVLDELKAISASFRTWVMAKYFPDKR